MSRAINGGPRNRRNGERKIIAAENPTIPSGNGSGTIRADQGPRALGARLRPVAVTAGKPARSGPGEPLAANGYFGREAETVAAIAAWMLHQPFPKDIE